MHHGVFIDVFPLDGYSEEFVSKEEISKAMARHIRRKCIKCHYPRFKGRNLLGIRTNVLYILNRLFGLYSDNAKYISECETVISKSPIQKSDVWCNYADCIPGKEYEPRWYYGEGTWATFETLKVRIPEHYDEYLTNRFGNWRADLPEEEKVGHHYYEIMD
jgi:lipopolysaccharide cholinephosphotransferase